MISAAHRRVVWNPTTAEEQAEVLIALEEVLASTHFCNSKRYPALLRYVVEQTLKGHGDEIKERTVGIDVFGRAPDYDTNLDTVVRYSAGEVRKRLALYYTDLGDSPVVISLSPRSYRPEFLRLAPDAPPVDEIPAADSHSALPDKLDVINVKEKHTLTWTIAAASALLLLLVVWNTSRTDAVGRFWSPILDQKTPAIISLGGVKFSPRSNIGTEVASDTTSLNPYLSFENGLAMGRVAALLNARGGSYRVQPASSTTLAQIRENPTVLVGAYNNEWTYRMISPLRFHFTAHPEERIVDTQNPSRSWARNRSKPFTDTPDYALVARFRNPSTDSLVIVIAGIQRFGTDAASQFATSSELLQEFNRQVGWNWRNKNVEVVLRVDVVNGRAGAPIIEATHIW
ncbi:hypothetical protein [Edaphobacter aggregans]|uniref:hypothetical protein n=1 Tax=Edaphobacter aggregans TaxID=570835 RepID=UPI00054F7E34|nr:hypothetical protein [Edaphobacter aggregans]